MHLIYQKAGVLRGVEIPICEISNHCIRGAGITEYLRNGGDLETAARIAGHESDEELTS